MISVTSQYALRALVHLAAMPPGKLLLGRQLSQEAAIPANYLSKILLVLGNAGLIAASRGSGGGYRLIRPPKQIRLMEVVELFDRHLARPACLLGLRAVCSDDDPCIAHASWRRAKNVFLDFLEKTTLADISDRARILGKRREPVRVSRRRRQAKPTR